MRQIYNVESPPSSMLYDTSALNDYQLLQNSPNRLKPSNTSDNMSTNTTSTITNATTNNVATSANSSVAYNLYEGGLCNLHELAKNCNLGQVVVPPRQQQSTKSILSKSNNSSPSRLSLANLMPSRFAFIFSRFL